MAMPTESSLSFMPLKEVAFALAMYIAPGSEKSMWLAARKTITKGKPVSKKPKVVPKVTATADLGEINIAIKIATWLATVYDAAGGMNTRKNGIIGINMPIAISKAVAVSSNK